VEPHPKLNLVYFSHKTWLTRKQKTNFLLESTVNFITITVPPRGLPEVGHCSYRYRTSNQFTSIYIQTHVSSLSMSFIGSHSCNTCHQVTLTQNTIINGPLTNKLRFIESTNATILQALRCPVQIIYYK